MATTVSSSAGLDFPIPDEGAYVFQLAEVRETRTDANIFWKPKGNETEADRPDRTSVPLLFEVVESPDDEDQLGMEVLQFFSLTLGNESRPSNLRPFIAALSAAPVSDDEDYELEDYVGTRIRGTVVHQPRQNGGVKAVIQSPLPYRKKKAKVVEPPPVEEEEETDDPFK